MIASPIRIESPPHTLFGVGMAREAGRFAAERGARTVLVVADPAMRAQLEALEIPAACALILFDAIAGEPDTETLARAIACAEAAAPDLVIGFGGGSTMDVAKLVAVLSGSGLGLADVVGVERTPARRIGLVQVPTTAGTGSEAGTRALVGDPGTGTKLAVQSRHMLADMAVIDPRLSATVPPRITAETGVDALAHCVEAFTNAKAHPAIDLYAMEGIRLIGRHLRRATEAGDDLEARGGMALAAFYGGLCLGPVNTTAGHAIAYPLSTRHHIAHGAANAIIFPHVLAFNARAVPERTATVLRLLGLAAAGDVFDVALRFCESLGIETSLARRGIPETDLAGMAAEAAGIRRLLDNNPRAVTTDDILRIYRAAY
jgi:alcohol dehydrogenase class IV